MKKLPDEQEKVMHNMKSEMKNPEKKYECDDDCKLPSYAHISDTPTLTEQKGEELEKFYFVEYQDVDEFTKDLGTYIAAKKQEWEAQKEQAVKAEIREMIKGNSYEIETNDTSTGKVKVIDLAVVLLLLSDK